jgi:signal recognition particle subunit SRP72
MCERTTDNVFFLWKERWIPKALRKAAAKSKQDKKGKGKLQEEVTGFGFQGVALEGGGIGSTGSARIAGFKYDAPPSAETKKEEPKNFPPKKPIKGGKKKR